MLWKEIEIRNKLKGRVLRTFSIYILYQTFFFYLETLDRDFNIIYHWIDDYIPFVEYFVVPYGMWFIYLAFSLLYFALNKVEEREYNRYLVLLFGGMTLCLVINFLWPSAVNLRPTSFPRDNIFIDIVKGMHRVDTPTNVCPSIHVYSTVVVHYALVTWTKFGKKVRNRILSGILMVAICISTVFLKQHSIIDLVAGAVMGGAIFYLMDYLRSQEEKINIKSKSKTSIEGN